MLRSAQFKTHRESLGLTTQWIAENLKNKKGEPLAIRTVQYWEAGNEYPEDEIDDLFESIEDWIDDSVFSVEGLFLTITDADNVEVISAITDDDDLAVQFMRGIAFFRPVDDAAWQELGLPDWLPQSAYIHFLGLILHNGALKQMPDVQPIIVWASAEDIVKARLGNADRPLELADEIDGYYFPDSKTILRFIE